jgi:hypothetical protein
LGQVGNVLQQKMQAELKQAWTLGSR